ncbi:hypothetical protein KDX14_33060 [Burkholderia cenocepacia]|uniref:hypothetical protein n=1 Tax=Burkholderia cenocepacia TaxID=95486 RepID=UPI001B8F13FD|nr:hypothetical protein [Burkholderia cenocepacia]MBR8074356.1 hypothetical protein [Burkholderia cenocepacia]
MAANFSGAQGFLQNPLLATLSPDQQQNLLQLQQRQAVGQALLAQGLQPADYGGANIGGLAYHVSPLNGISKLVNAYVGNKLSMDAMGQQAQLMGQMYGNAFGVAPGGASGAPADGGQTVDMPPPAAADTGALQGPSAGLGLTQPTPMQLGQAMGAPAPRAAAPMAGPMSLPGKTPQESMLLYSMLGPEGYARVAAAWGAPTDATRMALAGGVDPASANRDALFKANYVAPNQGTPGTIARDPRTNQPIYYSPSVPDGAQPVFDASGNLAGVAPLAGARDAIAGAAQARTAGEGAALPYAGFDAAGNPMPVTNRTAAAMGGGAPGGAAPNLSQIFMQQESSGGRTAPDNPFQIQKPTFDRFAQPGESWNNVADRNAVAQRMLTKFNQDYGGDIGRIATAYFSGEGNVAPAGSPTPYLKNVSDSNGKTVSSYVSDMVRRAGAAPAAGGGSGAIYAAQPPGVVAGASAASTNQQGELSKKWTDLTAQNQQAQSVISNLQNIKTLAGKAIVGPQSDRLAYANSLLSLAGSERATDMVTANDLLNKYSNQITARLGQGGLGTDAARAILQSAYPNSHMTQGAINEAADNLIGAQQMVQAKARVLAPLRNSNDAAGYTNAELTFDQNADPRIFQYTGIKDPTARAAFAKNLMAQDPGIVGKIQALQKLGALQ